jgi:hypothetical protein
VWHLVAPYYIQQTRYRYYKLSKKINIPFSGPCLSKIIRKNPITSQIFIVRGLNTDFHACSMNDKQLMNMHL